MIRDMSVIDLTFRDLMRLAVDNKIEKDGVTVRYDRPVLSKVTVYPRAKTGRVEFFIDETDDRRYAEFEGMEK
jgi:hypothetical protein